MIPATPTLVSPHSALLADCDTLYSEDLRHGQRSKRAGVDAELAACFPGERFAASVHEVEHHLAHLASAFLVSPFDEAVAVSVDGFGDFASAAWGVGRGNRVEAEDKVYFPHSLGIFYQALTQFLGFPNYGDEYKVMGLAPYGEPAFLPQMRKLVRLREGGGFELARARSATARSSAIRGADRGADGAQHLVQRERAGGVPARGGARLLPAHEDGCAGDGGLVRCAVNPSGRGGVNHHRPQARDDKIHHGWLADQEGR